VGAASRRESGRDGPPTKKRASQMNTNQETKLRPANPDYDEGLLFARYLDQAAEGFFRFMLGRNSHDVIAEAFLEPGHDLSHEHVVFAERDSRILGMGCSFSSAQHAQSSDEPLKRAEKYPHIRAAIAATLCFPLIRFLETLDDGDFYLLALAVDPEYRGEGVGSRLMDFVEDCARAAGAERVCLDVSTKNRGARRLYERRGMTVQPETPTFLRIPVPLLARMSKRL